MRPLLVLAALAVGCAPPLESQLRSCDLVTEGELGPRIPLYAPNDCYARCFASASCDALEAAICRTDVQLLIACDRECAFACAGGELLPVERVCDGNEDCAGGEDEDGCAVHRCDDGQEIAGDGHRCDGRYACRDGSDEAGCPERRFVCDDGELVWEGARCDGWAACDDGSDEAGCAEPRWTCSG